MEAMFQGSALLVWWVIFLVASLMLAYQTGRVRETTRRIEAIRKKRSEVQVRFESLREMGAPTEIQARLQETIRKVDVELADINRQFRHIKIGYRAVVAVYGLLAGTLVGWTAYDRLIRHNQQSLIDLLIAPALAQVSPQGAPELAALLIKVVFVTIVLAFFFALAILVFMKDKDENRRALETADNIVKMFGGFLIGVGSSFFGIK
ncbi:hypothetical protein [Reyranella sp.]|uniref:hypothetical protein n=1 Tax=Reyranella sp. TaxID=1929291 RepID=UPI003783B47A